MKQIELLKLGENTLKEFNIDDAHIKANILLQYILKQTKQQLIINSKNEVKHSDAKLYKENIQKLINGTPLQYITNKQQFMGLNFYIDENVLIPQPDTEILVEEAIKIIKQNNLTNVLDLCTGSGAIAISIANYCLNTQVTATDISAKALNVAKKNSKQNNVNIEFAESNLFERLQKNKFDVIVSNPPYIETEVIKTLSKEVKNEPLIALDGGQDGLKFYKAILQQANNYLNKNGYLLLEIGYNQGQAVLSLEYKNLKLITKQPIKDLSGNDRVIIFQKE